MVVLIADLIAVGIIFGIPALLSIRYQRLQSYKNADEFNIYRARDFSYII